MSKYRKTKDGRAGGVTVGKSHQRGGMETVIADSGDKIEVESGEGILSRKTMTDNSKYEFEGRELTPAEIASKLNTDNGGNPLSQHTAKRAIEMEEKFAKGGKIESFHTYEDTKYKLVHDKVRGYSIEGVDSDAHKIFDRSNSSFVTALEAHEYAEFRIDKFLENQFAKGGTVNKYLPNSNDLYLGIDTLTGDHKVGLSSMHKGTARFDDQAMEDLYGKGWREKMGKSSMAKGGSINIESEQQLEKYIKTHLSSELYSRINRQNKVVIVTLHTPLIDLNGSKFDDNNQDYDALGRETLNLHNHIVSILEQQYGKVVHKEHPNAHVYKAYPAPISYHQFDNGTTIQSDAGGPYGKVQIKMNAIKKEDGGTVVQFETGPGFQSRMFAKGGKIQSIIEELKKKDQEEVRNAIDEEIRNVVTKEDLHDAIMELITGEGSINYHLLEKVFGIDFLKEINRNPDEEEFAKGGKISLTEEEVEEILENIVDDIREDASNNIWFKYRTSYLEDISNDPEEPEDSEEDEANRAADEYVRDKIRRSPKKFLRFLKPKLEDGGDIKNDYRKHLINIAKAVDDEELMSFAKQKTSSVEDLRERYLTEKKNYVLYKIERELQRAYSKNSDIESTDCQEVINRYMNTDTEAFDSDDLDEIIAKVENKSNGSKMAKGGSVEKVLSMTQSGKNIYAPNSFRSKTSQHYENLVEDYIPQDHRDAFDYHKEQEHLHFKLELEKTQQNNGNAAYKHGTQKSNHFATARYHASFFKKEKGGEVEGDLKAIKIRHNIYHIKLGDHLITDDVSGKVIEIKATSEDRAIKAYEKYQLKINNDFKNGGLLKGYSTFSCTREQLKQSLSELKKHNKMPKSYKKLGNTCELVVKDEYSKIIEPILK